LELEVDLVMIRYGILEEDGSKPKVKRTVYVSRLITLLDLKTLLSKNLGIQDISKIRIVTKSMQIIENEQLLMTIEECQDIFI